MNYRYPGKIWSGLMGIRAVNDFAVNRLWDPISHLVSVVQNLESRLLHPVSRIPNLEFRIVPEITINQ